MQFLPLELLGGPWDGQLLEVEVADLDLIPGAVLTYSLSTGTFAHIYRSKEPWDFSDPLLQLRHVAVNELATLDS